MKSWNKEHPLQLALREQLEPPDNQAPTAASRRTVVKLTGLAGIGLALGFSLAPRRAAATTGAGSEGFEPQWIRAYPTRWANSHLRAQSGNRAGRQDLLADHRCCGNGGELG